MKYRLIIVVLLLMKISTICPAQDTVRITDYGYMPGSRANAVPYVIKALNDCKTKNKPVLVFPNGRYDFWPQYTPEKLYYESNTDVILLRRCPILIEGFNKLEINCSNADLIFHDRMQPFTIDSSKNTCSPLNIVKK